MAILTLAEEEIDPFDTPYKSFAICVSDDSAINELGEEKALRRIQAEKNRNLLKGKYICKKH